MNCEKCIHYEVCRFIDYPFIKSGEVTCVFYNKDTSKQQGVKY